MSEADLTPEQLKENNGPYLNIANWSLVGTAAIFLVLRIHCKLKQSRGLWWDDHILTASWVRTCLLFLRNGLLLLNIHAQSQFHRKVKAWIVCNN